MDGVQLSFFDKDVSEDEKRLREILKRGSGFSGGQLRIYAAEQLLDADNPVEKLWILLSKYLDLPEMFGPDLTSVLMQMDLQGRFGLEEAVLDFVGRYYKWFLRFAKECQQDGIIQTPGDLQRLVEFGVELTFYTVSQWCSSGGSFPLRPRVYEKMEDFYVIAPEYRGLWKKEPGFE